MADYFNDWVNKWELIKINPGNRRFMWSNNKSNKVQAGLDRIFVSADLNGKFPLASVTCMPKDISDHTPLLYVSDAGNLLAVEDSSLRSGG
jgi:hypothetical protein